MFLLSRYTGLHYPDLVSIRPEHVRDNMLRLVMHKTKDVVTVPPRPEATMLVMQLAAGELRPVARTWQ